MGDKRSIPTTDLAYYPRLASASPVYSAKDIMTSDKLVRSLAGRVVVLGPTAPEITSQLHGYAGQRYTPVTWSAAVVAIVLGSALYPALRATQLDPVEAMRHA